MFDINQWDGQTDTKLAVKPIEIFTPEKSEDIINNETKKYE